MADEHNPNQTRTMLNVKILSLKAMRPNPLSLSKGKKKKRLAGFERFEMKKVCQFVGLKGCDGAHTDLLF